MLRELFAALGNDPFVIAECLARPLLAERFVNGDPVATAPNAFRAAHPTRMPPQKPALAGWLAKAETQVPVTMAAATASYTLPAISDQPSECIDNWIATSTTNAPEARYQYTAVWTGSEMIVWGGCSDIDCFGLLNTGGRYNPSTDSWTATSTTNAPEARYEHTAVWTGSEMIVWGGTTGDNTGGRYNPSTDSWAATSTTHAPIDRYYHTAVWTGSEMIVWGGVGFLHTGGRYNPSSDSWTRTSITNAPEGRYDHTAVWAGSEMIVWGGVGDVLDEHKHNTQPKGKHDVNTGGRYNPGTDSWTATSRTNAPDRRNAHTAVWSGSEMIVWGGGDFGVSNTGGNYNPGTDSWTATSSTNAPDARADHTAVWSGSEMIVWGGADGITLINTGRYCAAAPTPRIAPTPRARPTPPPRP